MNNCSYVYKKGIDMNVDKKRLEKVAYILKSLAHENRLCVLAQLIHTKKEMSVSDLMQGAGCEQSLLSHHLRDLKTKGILNSRREGQRVLYSINDEQIIPIVECILNYCKKINV